MRRVFTIDFETTGIDAKTCEVCEVAVYSPDWFHSTLVKPSIPIPPETSAVHHITDEDVKDAPDWFNASMFVTDLLREIPGEPLPVLVAHNAEYEKTIVNKFLTYPILWICTYKCALRVWPDAPSHKNEVLRYFLKLGTSRGRSGKNAAHSALHDAQVTYQLLTELLKHATLEELIQWTDEPARLPRMPMGKHIGETWDKVPAPYLKWITQQADMRTDVKQCAEAELKRRR